MNKITKSRLLPQKKKQTQQPQPKTKHTSFTKLPNQQFIIRNLKLLGVSQSQYFKQTKGKLEGDIFPKNQPNPAGSKQFFFISYISMKNLVNDEQIKPLQMWYPPRTVNEQLQYKKVLIKMVKNLQNTQKIPKNILVSKNTIMGQANLKSVVEFLRFLSQLALRNQYIQNYSKRQRLIQVSIGNSHPSNNINNFYLYPFVPSAAVTEYPQIDLQAVKMSYEQYIKIYLKKIALLRTQTAQNNLNEQNIIRKVTEEKQLNQTLLQKLPKKILSQNRAFDRRRIIDRNKEIWDELFKIYNHFIDQKQIPIINYEGQIDVLLTKWQPVKGILNINQANNLMQNLNVYKKKCEKNMKNFDEIKSKLLKQLNQ